MRIKKITVENFKSFKGSATIETSPTTTVILGKNGSGKSNLLSAVHLLISTQKITAQERIELLHEGNALTETSCMVCILFDNEDMRFPGAKTFTIKRIIDSKKDEYFLNDKVLSHDEMRGLFESAGLCLTTPYFVIMQGRVQTMAMLDDEGRYDLIKNVAGASKYENDRKASLEILQETLSTQKKIENMLDKVEQKLLSLEKDKKVLEECETLEKEKRRYEVSLAYLEIKKINEDIKEIERNVTKDNYEQESDDSEDIDSEVKRIRNKIDQLSCEKNKITPSFESSTDIKTVLEKKNDLLKKAENFGERINKDIEILSKLKEEEKECFIKYKSKKYLLDYVNMFKNKVKDGVPLNIQNFIDKEIAESHSMLTIKQNDLSNFKDDGNKFEMVDPKKLQSLVEERKILWREEKKLKNEKLSLTEILTSQENKMILAGNNSYKIYKKIKDEPGVIGCVFELFMVPHELIEAFETVTQKFLFNIVVENEEVATKLLDKVDGSVTFIPLNRMFYSEPLNIKDENIFLLSSQIRYDQKYANLLNYITKNTFVASDVKIGNEFSKKYNINIVTVDGDFINKNGVITGGYEKKVFIFKEFKKVLKDLRSIDKKLSSIKSKVENYSIEIELIEKRDNNELESNKQGEYLKATIQYLTDKLSFLDTFKKENKIKLNLSALEKEIKSLEFKNDFLAKEIFKQKLIIDENKSKIERIRQDLMQVEVIVDEFEKLSDIQIIQEEINRLKEREIVLKNKLISDENKLFSKIKGSDFENEKLIAKKHLLYNKRNEICKKIGVTDYLKIEPFYLNLGEDELILNLKKIKEELKKFAYVNKRAVSQWENHIEQKNSFKDKIKELKLTHEKITGFINQLDLKKQESLDNVFSLICIHFKYFIAKLSNFGNIELFLEDKSLYIKINGNVVDTNTLSGGQKTMIALALTFSIQKIDPSPFYIFDEVDANLDKEGRIRVCSLINSLKEQSQYIFTTFREKMIECGDKFIGVSFSDKMSYVAEIDKNIAVSFLSDNVVE